MPPAAASWKRVFVTVGPQPFQRCGESSRSGGVASQWPSRTYSGESLAFCATPVEATSSRPIKEMIRMDTTPPPGHAENSGNCADIRSVAQPGLCFFNARGAPLGFRLGQNNPRDHETSLTMTAELHY